MIAWVTLGLTCPPPVAANDVRPGSGSALSVPGPPVSLGYRIFSPRGPVANDSTLVFYAFWDSAQYDVTADVSRIDAGAAQPLAGEYVGDSTIVVGDATHVWPCYRFAHAVSATNSRADGRGIRVPVTAHNALTAQSATDSTLELCLSNHPPVHDTTVVIGDPARFVTHAGERLYMLRNGDSLYVETTWHTYLAPFSVEADYAALDDSFSAERVYYTLVSAPAETLQTHGIYYELDARAQGPDSAVVPVRIFGRDGGCGRTSWTFHVLLDNQPPQGSPVFDALPASTAQAQLTVRGTAPPGSDDVLIVLNHTTQVVVVPVDVGTPDEHALQFVTTLTLSPGMNHIVAYGRDLVGNRSTPSLEHFVELLYTPQFKQWLVLEPDSLSSASTGEVTVDEAARSHIQVRSYWDSAEYEVRADFRNLDSAAEGLVPGYLVDSLEVPAGSGTETWYGYDADYTLSSTNTRGDNNGIVVPLTAYFPASGFSTTIESLHFCLSNRPPRHLWTRIIGDSTRFVERDDNLLYLVRNGGSIELQTSWESTDRPLYLSVDFSRADQDFLEWYVSWWPVDSLSSTTIATYGIGYNFSTDACCPEGGVSYPLPVRIRVGDSGCGRDSTFVLLEMDNTGPTGSAVFDPLPPADTVAESLWVSGHVPSGTYDLLTVIEHVDADSTTSRILPVDSLATFAGYAPLLPGLNRLSGYARDAVGNRATSSPPCDIRRVTTARTVTYPKPFHPGDGFAIQDASGWSRIELAIYNLEGDKIRSWADQFASAAFAFEAVWDGRNGENVDVHPGPYLLRIRTTDTGGRAQEEIKAFVFTR